MIFKLISDICQAMRIVVALLFSSLTYASQNSIKPELTNTSNYFNENSFSLSDKIISGITSDFSDVIHECAIDLCGDPTDSHFNMLADEFLNSDRSNLISDVATDLISKINLLIEEGFELVHQKNSEIIKYLEGVNGDSAKLLDQNFYNTIYEELFLFNDSYEIRYDQSRYLGDRFYLYKHPFFADKFNTKITEFFEKKIAYINKLQKNSTIKDNPFRNYTIWYPLNIIDFLYSIPVNFNYNFREYFLNCDHGCKELIDQLLNVGNLDQLLQNIVSQNNEIDEIKSNCIDVESKKSQIEFEFLNYLNNNYDLNTILYNLESEVKEKFFDEMVRLLGTKSETLLSRFLNSVYISAYLFYKHSSAQDPESIIRLNKENTLINLENFIEEMKYSNAILDKDASGFERFLMDRFDFESGGLKLSKFKDQFCGANIWSEKDIVISLMFTHDGFDETLNEIYLSPISLLYPTYGRETLIHELNHAFSHTIIYENTFLHNLLPDDARATVIELDVEVYNKYMALRQCASDSYKNPIDAGKYKVHNGDFLKTEEDFADIITYLTFRDEPTVHSCEPYYYIKTLFNNSGDPLNSGMHTLNANPDDPHSTILLRLVREALYKGYELPTSCKSLMEENEDQINFNLCF